MTPLPSSSLYSLIAARACGLLLAACAALLSSCTSTPKIQGVPGNLDTIPLYGAARTPPHNMPRSTYPFDSNGNYVTSWAAEAGGSAGPSDYQPERRSSSSSSTRRVSSSPPARVSSSTKKSSSSARKTSDDPPPSKSKSSTAKKSSGGGVKHVVKGSDTLFSLAKRYGTTVDKIKSANGLSGNTLKDGRTLTIPQ